MSDYNVTTTSSEALPFRQGRWGWSIRNLSDVAINLTYDGSAPVTIDSGSNPGEQIAPGETIRCTREFNERTPANAVNVIHASAGNKRVSIQEW